MKRHRKWARLQRLCITSSCALALVGCGHKASVAPAGAGQPGAVASATAATREESPRLTNSADGVHIEYHVYGTGEPALVLVHAWACDSNYWSAQVAHLKTRYSVATLDLAGHGASGRNRLEWSLKNYGEDVAAVIRQLPNRQVVLIGHSMGGPVALEAANILRQSADSGVRQVLGVIGVDTFKQIGEAPLSRAKLDAALQPFEEDFIGTTRRFVSESLFTKNADPKFVSKVAYDMSLEPADIALASLRALNAVDYPTLLAGLAIPVVAINSDLGPPVDEARIRKIARSFRLVVLPRTGHFLMMEAPDRFNPILDHEIQGLLVPAHRA